MARNKIQSPFVLFESDLIFDPSMLKNMLYPDRIAASHILPWMNGTTITTDSDHNVTEFNPNTISVNKYDNTYKTVNIYSFSRQTWKRVAERLDDYISAGKVNDYYETVFAEMISDCTLNFKCVMFEKERWYEIDTMEDLNMCELMLLNNSNQHVNVVQNITNYESYAPI